MNKKIVCLGGGIGTVNLIRGLKKYSDDITVIVSMADEGGSSGRLRRLYNISPPGDMVSCMAALCGDRNELLSKLFTYRFPGDRYGKDNELSGQKLGNLIIVALRDITGSFNEAIPAFQKLFQIPGTFLPATAEPVTITARTVDGKEVVGEENIDLGKYNGKRVLERVYLNPKDAKVSKKVIKSLQEADVIIAGPGDLYTTILPVLIIPSIRAILSQSKAKRLFIVNVANKPFETKDYSVSDYMTAVVKHLGVYPFDKVVVNNNFSISIPRKYKYSYVSYHQDDKTNLTEHDIDLIEKDLVDEKFPLYHDSQKLAKVVSEEI